MHTRLFYTIILFLFPVLINAQFDKDQDAVKAYNEIIEALDFKKVLKAKGANILSPNEKGYITRAGLKAFTEYQLIVVAAPSATTIRIEGSGRKRPCDGCYNLSSGIAYAGKAKFWGYRVKTDNDGYVHFYYEVKGLERKQYVWYILMEIEGGKNPYKF